MLRTAVLLLALTACAEGLPLDQLDDAHADADCAWLVRCGFFDTQARCRAGLTPYDWIQVPRYDDRVYQRPLQVTPSLAAAVEAGLVTYDPVQAEECMRLIEGTACNPGDQTRRLPFILCIGAFRSGRPNGAECSLDAECASRFCEVDGPCDATCCTGRCTQEIGVGGIGSSCIDYPCGPTSFCYFDTCVPLLPRETPCTEDRQCDFGLVCMDTCRVPLVAGDPCEFTARGWSCGGDVTCDQTSLRCTPWLAMGAACEPDHDRCGSHYAWCDPSTRTCAPFPKLGEPCPGRSCQPGAWCAQLPPDGSICAALAPDGAQCNDSGMCASGTCRNQVCADGAVCF